MLEKVNSRLDEADDQISDLEEKVAENTIKTAKKVN